MHQTVGNILRTLLYSNPPQNMTQARDILDSALATAMHAMRTTVATTLGSTPGSLAFSRDMFSSRKPELTLFGSFLRYRKLMTLRLCMVDR